jgi:hypothetical protein
VVSALPPKSQAHAKHHLVALILVVATFVPLTKIPVLVVKPRVPIIAWGIYEAEVNPNDDEPY